MPTHDKTGQVALVTGASRGIGQALAIGFADAGYDVIVTDLPQTEGDLRKTADMIAMRGRKAHLLTLDVSDREQIDSTVRRAIADAGRIDVLVNNAGVLKPSLLQDLDDKTWDTHFDVNVKGVSTQGHYATTKAAVVTLTRVLAQEVGMDGITVNAICPGIILTEMGRNNLGSDEAVRHWENTTALKRLGYPEDIVGPVLFFASEQSAFVTGQALNVCGGIQFH
ncbi:3-oxoacyl-[acyl-carrier protein] reductase [Candidatus Burkholderia verschuerenii]|uniref:3-oxoacyl-[acyl-carrier protein] reductase n=1 Tax=Candidatus Burkholderia verschuerenii TaxID=242163 RepID=A0A0L0MIG5_9BURK|nr:SDR family NAD(P)-dependent oxidoreductase [Candidatus Burkholderia verschuerenii]KND62080.1 3-oxoacyl-[acyl-carrier protein] reductase [Candidatus Burkholderia verschuerenii]